MGACGEREGWGARELKLDDFEARDEAKVAEIGGQDREAEFQRRSSNQQVAEWDGHALGLLLAIDLSGHHAVALV